MVLGAKGDSVSDLLLDLASRKLEGQQDVITQLDQKSSVILGFSLVSVVEILGFLLLVAAEHPKAATHESMWVHVVFFSALALIIAGSAAGLLALRGNSSHCFHASEFKNLSSQIQDPEKFSELVLRSVESAIARNWAVIHHKRIELRIATIAVAAALLMYSILVGQIFISRF